MANLEDDAQIVAFRGAYERGRLVMAVKRAAPLLALVGMAMLVDGVRAVTVAAAAPLLALAIAMHWKSARHGGAVIPGLAVGMIPLTAMRTAQSFGHACVPGACYAVCIPMCVASGVVAGVVVGRFGRRSHAPLSAWVGAAALAFLTGALSCACVGVAGLVGLACGVALGTAPAVFGHLEANKSS